MECMDAYIPTLETRGKNGRGAIPEIRTLFEPGGRTYAWQLSVLNAADWCYDLYLRLDWETED